MNCRQPHTPTAYQLKELGLAQAPPGITFYQAAGCPSCSNKGYSGRTVIHELMVVDDDIRALVIAHADSGKVKKAAQKKGMRLLREDGIRKVFDGITTIEELMRATHSEET
jgi:general secretion pathway protein E